MIPADIEKHIDKLRSRSKELETALSSPEIFADLPKFRKLNQELSKINALTADFDRWVANLDTIEADKELLISESDAEMRSLLDEEIRAQRGQDLCLRPLSL